MDRALSRSRSAGSTAGIAPIADAAARIPTGPAVVVALWAAYALALIAFAWPSIATLHATDPDDYMRLLEVRDWLSGQPWRDVSQHRMGMPPGLPMHWSRLVDLPIAALLVVARVVLAEPAASAAAMALAPLLTLLAAMLLLRWLMRRLGQGRGTALAAAALVPLFPLLLSNVMPMRIDHHAWQAVCALACAAVLSSPLAGTRQAALAGTIAALWLTISLEGLALAIAFSGLFALDDWRRRRARFAAFALALGLVGGLLALAMRSWPTLLAAEPDRLSWPHLAAFTLSGALAALCPRIARPAARAAVLAVAASTAATLLWFTLGLAAVDPFHTLNPALRRLWLGNMPESLPIAAQDWSNRAMLAWTPLVVLAGWRLVPRHRRETPAWDRLALYALAAAAISFVLLRAAVAAQLLAVPFSALLLARLFPRARALRSSPARVVATVACLTLSTPSLASAAGRWLDHHLAPTLPAPALPSAPNRPCDLARLASLPPARLFAPFDLGPEILVRSRHSVVAGPYHRGAAEIARTFAAFGGDPSHAEALVRGSGAHLLVFCPAAAEAAIDSARRPDSLAARLSAGQPPSWLLAVLGFGGGLQVYAFTPAPAPKPAA